MYFTFIAGEKPFAIETSYIELIIPFIGMKEAPCGHVRGVVEFRGSLVNVIDFCALFGGKPCEDKMHARIALVHNGLLGEEKRLLGVLGECATAILEAGEPLLKSQDNKSFIHSVMIDGALTSLIDVPELFKDADYADRRQPLT